MKPARLLLVVSLVANVVLLVAWVRHDRAPPASASVTAGQNAARSATAAAAQAEQQRAALLTALAAGDTAALKTAGVSDEVIRHLAAARAFARMVALQRDENSTAVIGEFWRKRFNPAGASSTAKQAERHAAERELDRALREAFGDRWMGGGGDGPYAFLPLEKQEKIRRIERDYEEMENEISQANRGLELPADRRRRELLGAEKDRDLATVLTPTERAQIERRSSPPAQAVIHGYGDILASEEEFDRLEALQRQFHEHFNKPSPGGRARSPEEQRGRAEAEAHLNDEIRAVLGEDRWAARDPAARNDETEAVRGLTARLGLGATAADGVFAMRDNYATQSVAIQQNSTLSAAERRTQLTQLAGRARDELVSRLGADGADSYVNSSGWVQALQRGNAFTTDPRQLPPGSPRPAPSTIWFALPAPKG